MSALLDAALTVKHENWAYESEVRIISNESGLHSFRAEALDRIVLGLNTSKKDESIIRSLLNTELWKHVRLFKTKRGNAALSLDVEEVDRKTETS